jgi:hypothetical protein
MRDIIRIVEMATAYHGTPHDVSRFSTKHIGTGEGAQAYGWGLYFSQSEDVAEWYRQQLTGDRERDEDDYEDDDKFLRIDNKVIPMKTPLNQLTPFQRAAMDWWFAGRSRFKAAEEIEQSMEMFPGNHDHPNYKHYEEELKILRTTEDFHSRVRQVLGNRYSVNIIPKDDQFLVWDIPLTQQSDFVKRCLGGISDETGKQFYQRLTKELGSQKTASEYLDQRDIPGIRYFDGHSRYKGEGHYNYVVFDDRHVGDASSA